MFECMAITIASACGGGSGAGAGAAAVDPAALNACCDSFEALLFPLFQDILRLDIAEFTPYVFQLLAMLLAYRPGSTLSQAYQVLFVPLLSPALWERRGNVPALVELLDSYLQRDVGFILSTGHLQGKTKPDRKIPLF